jgi:hypothetical protein
VNGYGGNLYWVESDVSGNGRVATTSVGGGPSTTLTTTTGSFAAALAVDASNVYWVNESGPGVMSVPVSGGAATTLATVAGRRNIAIDGTSVYWTVPAISSALGPVPGAVYKVAKTR